MLAQLAAIVPSGNDGRIVREWLSRLQHLRGRSGGLRPPPAHRSGARFYEDPEGRRRADQHPDRHPGHGQPHGRLRGPRRPVLSRIAWASSGGASLAWAMRVQPHDPNHRTRPRCPAWVDAMRTGFLAPPAPDPIEAEFRRRPLRPRPRLGRGGRATRIVGTLRSFDTTLAVPGDPGQRRRPHPRHGVGQPSSPRPAVRDDHRRPRRPARQRGDAVGALVAAESPSTAGSATARRPRSCASTVDARRPGLPRRARDRTVGRAGGPRHLPASWPAVYDRLPGHPARSHRPARLVVGRHPGVVEILGQNHPHLPGWAETPTGVPTAS